jgi:hypothetical protein
MDVLAYCRAMAAFCRQHAELENEGRSFWIKEAEEWDRLIVEHSTIPKRASAKKAAIGRSASASDETSHPS